MQRIGVGEGFAGYTIVAHHSTGGMSSIYEATEPHLGRRVALKVIAADLSSDESFRERFTHEARQAAAIDHPNIIPIYGFGEVDGSLYIAMRFVAGSDLGQLIRADHGLTAERAVRLLTQAAAALDAVHAAGMIHRDVKPANFLVSRPAGDHGHEHVYLADFGITRSESREPLTRAGEFIGTIAYASPEQLRNDPLTSASDVYAFGCLAYEVLTGSRPFRRDNNAAVIYAHLGEAPPKPSESVVGLDERVDAVIAAAMAKDPAERPASAGAVAAALGEALGVDAGALGSGVVPAVADARAEGHDDDEVTEIRERAHDLERPPVIAAGSASGAEPGFATTRAEPGAASDRGGSDRRRRRAMAALAGVAALIVVAAVALALQGRGSGNGEPTVLTKGSLIAIDEGNPTGSSFIDAPDATTDGGTSVEPLEGGDLGDGSSGPLGDDGLAIVGSGGSGDGRSIDPPDGADTPIDVVPGPITDPGEGSGDTTTTKPRSGSGDTKPAKPGRPVGVQAFAAEGINEKEANVELRWSRSPSGGAPTSYEVTATTYTYESFGDDGCTGTQSARSTVTEQVSSTSGTFRAKALNWPCAWVKWEVRAVNAAGKSDPASHTIAVPDIRGKLWSYQAIRGAGAIAHTDGRNDSCGVAPYHGCGTTPAAGASVAPGKIVRIWQQP